MINQPLPKVAAFIDGANIYATTKALGFDLDYKKLLTWLSDEGFLVRASYYTAVVEEDEHQTIRPLIDWLDYNGYDVVTKPTKKFTDSEGKTKIKGNMDIELAVDMLEIARHVDKIFLFSGDGDFRALVESAQRRGCRVAVVSTIKTQPSMVADELRRQTNEFIDLYDLKDTIGRSPGEIRPSRDSLRRQDILMSPVR